MDNYLVRAIQKLRPQSEFVITDNDYSTIQWVVLSGEAPSAKEVKDEIAAIKAQDIQDATDKETAKAALLARLGITEEEARLLLA